MTTIRKTVYRAQAALAAGSSPLPSFRDPDHDLPVRLKEDVPKRYRRYLGLDCGRRARPYRMQDRYDRNRTATDIPAIVLENEFLAVTFLPSLGGRLISLFNKAEKRELLYANKNFQVGNLAILDAWFAGGIEWNIGQYGHAFSTNLPVHASVQKDEEGRQFLRLYSFERAKELYFHLDFHLRGDLLCVHTAVHNLKETDASLYAWVNIAVETDEYLRVLASNPKAIYLDSYVPNDERLFGIMEMPTMPIYQGIDVSYPNRFIASNEYFFTCEDDELPWECALGKDGQGLFEASTHPLSYRKMFCWGTHSGGKRWQRYLSPDSTIDYVEIQSGVAPTQLHGEILPARSSVSWTQAFGLLKVDPGKAHELDYEVARRSVEEAVTRRINLASLKEIDREVTRSASIRPGSILHRGEGWGYLETRFQTEELPPAFRFEAADVGAEERLYLEFLESGLLPSLGGSSTFVPPVSHRWKKRFEEALSKEMSDAGRASLLHVLGIIYLEEEQVSLAETMFLQSLDLHPSAYTARNLGQLELRRSELPEALVWYEKSTMLPGFEEDWAIASEYLSLLLTTEAFETVRVVFDSIPPRWLEESEALRLARARLAVWEGNPELIQSLVFDRTLAHIREGETPLAELWNEMCVLRYCKKHGIEEITDDERKKVLARNPIPPEYDFEMKLE